MRQGLVALLLLAVSGFGALAGQPVFPRGSSVGLEPPAGMEVSTNFAGFEDKQKNASILVVDMPPDAYAQLEAGFTDAALAAKGIRVESRRPFPIGDARGMLVTGVQNAGPVEIRKWVLLVGGDTATALVTLQAPQAQAAAFPEAEVEAAFRTLRFRPAEEQLADLPFTITDFAGFRALRTLGPTSVILTGGPKNTFDGAEQPYFVIAVGGGAPRDDERRQFALRSLATVPGVKDLRIERAEPLRISNHAGYEVMATALDAKTGAPLKVVQWLSFGPTAHMRMVAVTRADQFPELYGRLRALRDGIEPR